jgi:hypothetical protein
MKFRLSYQESIRLEIPKSYIAATKAGVECKDGMSDQEYVTVSRSSSNLIKIIPHRYGLIPGFSFSHVLNHGYFLSASK